MRIRGSRWSGLLDRVEMRLPPLGGEGIGFDAVVFVNEDSPAIEGLKMTWFPKFETLLPETSTGRWKSATRFFFRSAIPAEPALRRAVLDYPGIAEANRGDRGTGPGGTRQPMIRY